MSSSNEYKLLQTKKVVSVGRMHFLLASSILCKLLKTLYFEHEPEHSYISLKTAASVEHHIDVIRKQDESETRAQM